VWSRFDEQTDAYEKMQAGSLLVPGTNWFDPFNPKARELFWSSMRDGLFNLGVDGWWLDATEPEFDLRNKETFFGTGDFVQNAYPLFVTQAVYQGQRGTSPNQRVFILTRAAYTGQQRNAAASWSGEINGTWIDFRQQISAGLNFTMTGIPYWTTDTGGFFRPDDQYVSPAYHELLDRWIEYSAFCPLFRMHGSRTETEIWKFGPGVEANFRQYDGLHYRLLPYTYSTAWMVTHDNYTMMRGLPLDFRTDPNVADIGDEFLFGPSLLVNPVTLPGAKTRSVYLPLGTEWLDFWTGEKLPGGQMVQADAPLETIPLYAKAGSIIPLGPVMQYVTETSEDPIEIRVYPGRDATFVLYEDEGTNYNYEKHV
jgi:alpha-D-xyloside xylohydrolase